MIQILVSQIRKLVISVGEIINQSKNYMQANFKNNILEKKIDKHLEQH